MLVKLYFYFYGSLLLLVFPGYSENLKAPKNSNSGLPAERTRAIALLFSYLQCFPSQQSNTDAPTQRLIQIHQTFHPESHLDAYKNRTDIVNLLEFVNQLQSNGTPTDLPFTNDPQHMAEMEVILRVLFHNADNWTLFYDTSTWLLHRVNSAQLWWALMITSLEKFSHLVTVPSPTETFPQLFAPKNYVLLAAGRVGSRDSGFPLQYWISDPRLHEFHAQWHMDNPFWWDDTVYGITRHRKGELFMYMHHQISCRYRAEWQSNGLDGEVQPLGLEDDYKISEGYTPDVINVNYADFFSRESGKRIGDFGISGLAALRTTYQRLEQGIEQGYFYGSLGSRVGLASANGTDILGNAVESSVESPNSSYYGSFHNFLHRELAGMNIPEVYPVPGTQSHPETAMRDPIFYRIHAKVDQLYLNLKSTLRPHTTRDLNFRGVSLNSVKIQNANEFPNFGWGSKNIFSNHNHSPVPVLKTFFTTDTYDIGTASRPCRAVNDPPVEIPVRILNHNPFSYQITVRSSRSRVAYGMVRIFMWPEYSQNGTLIKDDAIRTVAIELDRFRVRLNPGKDTVISRSSLDSSLTKRQRSPGLKQLYQVTPNNHLVSNLNIRRACGFPNNLLIPRGTKQGMPFKLVVYLSDETDAGDVENNQYPHYPLCGALNGQPFPDKRPMGFPFDRPGTRFYTKRGALLKNVKEIRVLVKHQE